MSDIFLWPMLLVFGAFVMAYACLRLALDESGVESFAALAMSALCTAIAFRILF